MLKYHLLIALLLCVNYTYTFSVLNSNPGSISIQRIKPTLKPLSLFPQRLEERIILPSDNIPQTFDSRKQWSKCKFISSLIDSYACFSEGVPILSMIQDRICIKSNSKVQIHLSVSNLGCCGFSCGSSCTISNPTSVLSFYRNTGIVTEQCIPSDKTTRNPKCSKQCQSSYSKSYEQDLQRGSSAYSVAKNVQKIQSQILQNGPVVATLSVYQDFLQYKRGVYEHSYGSDIGAIVVKIIGWGVEENKPYWLAVNHWGSDWGEKGFFKIIRGSNHCGIEANVAAAIPIIN